MLIDWRVSQCAVQENTHGPDVRSATLLVDATWFSPRGRTSIASKVGDFVGSRGTAIITLGKLSLGKLVPLCPWIASVESEMLIRVRTTNWAVPARC